MSEMQRSRPMAVESTIEHRHTGCSRINLAVCAERGKRPTDMFQAWCQIGVRQIPRMGSGASALQNFASWCSQGRLQILQVGAGVEHNN
jgi:hypothetical protein